MYQALIVEAKKLLPHPNADRLQLLDLGGEVVVVGLGVQQGQRLAWFPPDGQLSAEMAEANDLVKRYLPSGERDPNSGLFEENRRVRATSIRGVKSNGYACDISALAWTGVDLDLLTPGFAFAELNGKPVCNKYYSPATLRARSGANRSARRSNKLFTEWVDTAQLRYRVGDIPLGSVLTKSLKLHGTSHRVGNVLDGEGLSWFQRLAARLFGVQRHAILHGTRRVTLKGPDHQGFHGSNEFRYQATETLAKLLPPGFVAYGEIVGYDSNGKPIMSPVPTKRISPEAVARYGETMTFTYGQEPGECKFFLYALKVVTPDGEESLLSWPQTVEWAARLGVEPVPTMGDPIIYTGDPDAILEWAYQDAEGPDPIDPRHIREGVVIRVDPPVGRPYFLKMKSHDFYVAEGVLKGDDAYVDAEEAA